MRAVINKKNIFWRKRFWAGILLAQFLLFYAFSKNRVTVDFFENFFEIQKKFHVQLFAHIPFSVGDLLYLLLVIFLLFCIIKILKKRSRNRYLLKVLVLLNSLYFVYQFFWGMLYFQKPLLPRVENEKISLQETERLALKYLNLCIESRKLVQENRSGVFIVTDAKNLQTEIIFRQKQLPEEVTRKKSSTIVSFKKSFAQEVMSATGILGYYNPFTAEAQYNPLLPATFLPFTLAHESAHQMGFAREEEASFIGYLIGKKSKNPDLRYSTEYFVLKSLLRDLAEEDPEFVKKIIRNYSPAMQRDRLAEKLFVKKNEGFLNDFFSFTNDLFLKSNRQEGSITYSYFTRLLLIYEENQALKQ